MLTLEQYAGIYLAMTSAAGNETKEAELCAAQGFTVAEWKETRDFYTFKMMDPNDQGKTAMAFSAAMMKGAVAAPPLQKKLVILPPSDFVAEKVAIYISEFDIQMVEFINRKSAQFVTLQLGFEVNDDFEKDYIKGRVHISINEQSYSTYGGVKKVKLSSTAVTFEFDQEGADRMQCDAVTVSFTIDGKMYNYLKRKMIFMYGNSLEIKNEPTPTSYVVNGVTLHDAWQSFATSALSVSIRPKLQNIKELGKYNTAVFIDFNSATIGKDKEELALLKEVESRLIDTFEYDLSSVMAFHTTNATSRRFYIYSQLSQSDFMDRINEAFRLLPTLPLDFSGGADEKWENYDGCMADYEKNK